MRKLSVTKEDNQGTGFRARQKKIEKVRAILLLVIIAAAAVYVIGAAFYSRHFYLKNTIYGVKVTNQSVSGLKEKLAKETENYKLTVVSKTGEEIVSAQEIDMQADTDATVDNLKKKQNALLWVSGLFFKAEDVNVDVTFDEEKLKVQADGFSFMQDDVMKAPADAHLEYKDGSFQIVEQKEGTLLDKDSVYQVMTEAVTEGKTEVDLESSDCYVKHNVHSESEELKEEQQKLNDLINVKIVYDFSDRQETVDADQISQWITFGDDFSFDLDRDKVVAYMKELGYKYDTFGLSRTFRTSLGTTVKLKGGDYGWLINKEKSADALIEKIKAGESGTIQPEYRYEGKCRDTNDIGSTYIEVSISNQRMWCYVDGQCIVDTPVVTGNINIKGRATPSNGVWAIDAKMTNYNLVGEGYNSHVDYWMPFNGNVGIHNADWRNSFGGNIYKTNGSHGCVNTPKANAKKIYENVSIGTPVVVYD